MKAKKPDWVIKACSKDGAHCFYYGYYSCSHPVVKDETGAPKYMSVPDIIQKWCPLEDTDEK